MPGRRAASSPESRDAPMRNCASEVWSFGPSRNDGLIRLLAKCGAEGVAGTDPDDAEFAREEFQLLQCKREAAVVGMAVDVGVKLRSEEIAVDHVALELGHVDAVGGEPAERLVERGGQVAHPENKSRDQRSRSRF